MENKNDENEIIENSYILREYFKGFKTNNLELIKIREKINKTDRNLILDSLIKQNSEIYKIIAENYSSTIDMFQKISDQINKINDQANCSDIPLYSFRHNKENDEFNNDSSFDKEPISIKQLNANISDNLNKIQQYQNDIQAKNNIIESNLNQVKEDDNFLFDIEGEKTLYIESNKEFDQAYQYKLSIFLFNYVIKNDLNLLGVNACNTIKEFNEINNYAHTGKVSNTEREKENENIIDKDKNKNEDFNLNNSNTIVNLDKNENNKPPDSKTSITNLEKLKQIIFKEFKKNLANNQLEHFKKKLIQIQNEFSNFSQEQLREINKTLENLKNEAEKNGKNKLYDHFFFPILKSLKLIAFISLGKLRIDKIKQIVKKEQDDIISLNEKIKDILHTNSVYEKLKSEIKKKYENNEKDNLSNLSLNSNKSELNTVGNQQQTNNNNTESTNITITPRSLNDQKTNTNFKNTPTSTPSTDTQKDVITQLKLLHHNLENNYILLLKNISKKIVKPKDLVRRADSVFLSNKIN